MSYILEALKKSEQERASAREQDLLRFPVATPPAAPGLRPGMVLGVSALLLAGGIAIGWWKPWEKPPAPRRDAAAPGAAPAQIAPAQSVPTPAAPSTRAEALKELQPLLPGGGSGSASATSQPAAVPAKPESVAAPAPAPPTAAAPARPEAVAAVPATAPMAPVLPEVKPPPAAKVEEKKTAPKPAPLPPPPKRVLTLAELPPALKEALPPLPIRGFVYSEDARSRMVVISDRMLQEGDEVAPDLRLERIDPDGIVLNFRGYRFLAPK